MIKRTRSDLNKIKKTKIDRYINFCPIYLLEANTYYKFLENLSKKKNIIQQ